MNVTPKLSIAVPYALHLNEHPALVAPLQFFPPADRRNRAGAGPVRPRQRFRGAVTGR
jgi:hypothetical protein